MKGRDKKEDNKKQGSYISKQQRAAMARNIKGVHFHIGFQSKGWWSLGY